MTFLENNRKLAALLYISPQKLPTMDCTKLFTPTYHKVANFIERYQFEISWHSTPNSWEWMGKINYCSGKHQTCLSDSKVMSLITHFEMQTLFESQGGLTLKCHIAP